MFRLGERTNRAIITPLFQSLHYTKKHDERPKSSKGSPMAGGALCQYVWNICVTADDKVMENDVARRTCSCKILSCKSATYDLGIWDWGHDWPKDPSHYYLNESVKNSTIYVASPSDLPLFPNAYNNNTILNIKNHLMTKMLEGKIISQDGENRLLDVFLLELALMCHPLTTFLLVSNSTINNFINLCKDKKDILFLG